MNVIHLGLYYNTKIEIPKHPFFNIEILKNKFDNNNLELTDIYNFYYRQKIKNIANDVFNINRKKVVVILQEIFILKDIEKLDKNTVVIHVRSGDIFSCKKPHPGYLPPPLSYYVNILNSNKFKKIIIVAEDTKNPITNELLKLYPNIIYKRNTLYDDIKIILGATNIIFSIGTFIPALNLISFHICNVYQPSYAAILISHYETEGYKDINTYRTDLKDYYAKLIPWLNSIQQREIIMNYNKN